MVATVNYLGVAGDERDARRMRDEFARSLGVSLELVRASYRDFVYTVVDALEKTQFHPAYLGDCPVATRMKQRFFFKTPE